MRAAFVRRVTFSPGEGTGFPRSTCGLFANEFDTRVLCGAPEVIVMQPVHHCHIVDLPVGLDFSRFRRVLVDSQVSPLRVIVGAFSASQVGRGRRFLADPQACSFALSAQLSWNVQQTKVL